jgi:hypothetical protein
VACAVLLPCCLKLVLKCRHYVGSQKASRLLGSMHLGWLMKTRRNGDDAETCIQKYPCNFVLSLSH